MNIIDNLDERQVVSITLSKDKQSVKFMDGCDQYYSENYSKHELFALIGELTAIHSQMGG